MQESAQKGSLDLNTLYSPMKYQILNKIKTDWKFLAPFRSHTLSQTHILEAIQTELIVFLQLSTTAFKTDPYF